MKITNYSISATGELIYNETKKKSIRDVDKATAERKTIFGKNFSIDTETGVVTYNDSKPVESESISETEDVDVVFSTKTIFTGNIFQLDPITNEKIAGFMDTKEIKEKLNLHDITNINKVLKGQRTMAYGFKWSK